MSQAKIGVITSFYKGEKYLKPYFAALGRIDSPDMVEVLFIHNEPTDEELSIIAKSYAKLKCKFKHVIVQERETIYASWNRAISSSDCEYYALWSIDDLRMSDSLVNQAKTLDNNPGVGVTYGAQVNISSIGQKKGELIEAPIFNKYEFLRGCTEGTFVMWRRSVIEVAGMFDEQFKSGGDFEYWVRLILCGVLMEKTDGIMGYFLNEKRGASTDGTGLQPIERTVVELRYGIYDKIDYTYALNAGKYNIDHLYFSRVVWDIRDYVKGYDLYLKENKHLWLRSIPKNISLMRRRILAFARKFYHEHF